MERKNISAAVVRIGISLVFLWFGSQQILHTDMWLIMVPGYATNLAPFSAHTLVLINGITEILLGTLLLLGIWTKVVSGLLALHALHIVTIVGYSAIGVRDFGIAVSTISIFLNGPDIWTVDWKIKKIPSVSI